MNFKRYHVSRNLCLVSQNNSIYYAALNKYSVNNNSVTVTGEALFGFICKALPNTNYTVSAYTDTIGAQLRIREYSDVPTEWSTNFVNQPINKQLTTYSDASFTTGSSTNYFLVVFYTPLTTTHINIFNIMLNSGSTPLPYEPYSSEVWHDTPHYIHKTSTDTLTTLPADIFPNAATATVGLKGNMSQTGTPTPTTPIQPSECGDLETTGEHTGQYKIPISSASTTTPVYLGEVQSIRRIKKLVLTGSVDENITLYTIATGNLFRIELPSLRYLSQFYGNGKCTHYRSVYRSADRINGTISGGDVATVQGVVDIVDDYATVSDFKTYLAAQYAAGTPVTVWYVLATEETGIVNEPIRKIGDYADEVSGISIPVTAGGDTISVDTTLQPSEMSATYKGWHPAIVHERTNGAWT